MLYEIGLVNSLFSRLEYVTKGGMAREQETQRVTDELLANGYPRKFIESTGRRTPSEDNTTIATASIPYVKGVSETITRVLKPLNIRTVCRPHPMKWTMMRGAKDTLPQSEQPGAVYALGCMECNKVYIGETGRTAKVRAKEHEASTRYGYTEKSAVAFHALTEGHQIHWKPHVVEREEHCGRRKVKEALTITKLKEKAMNQDSGLELSSIWKNLVLQPPRV